MNSKFEGTRKGGLFMKHMVKTWIPALFLAAMLALPVQTGSAAEFDPTRLGPPQVEDLYMVIIRDPDAQVLALEKGDIDILGDIFRPADVERLSKNPEIDLSLSMAFHGFFLGFNLREEPWSRLELRQAAWQSIPREELVRDIFSGYAAPLSTFLPPSSRYFEKDVLTYPYDPEKARTLLKEKGWTLSSNGHVIPPGSDRALEKMSILSPTAQVAPTTFELATRIAGYLEDIGIPAQVEPMDFATMLSRLDNHKFDSYVLAWSMSRDPDSLYSFYHSSMDIKGGYNIPGIHNPRLDTILENLRYSPDRESGEKYASLAQKELSRLVPVIPVYSRYSIGAVSREWSNIVKSDVTTGDNIWTLIGTKPVDGKKRPLYWCLPEEPRALNPFTASTAYDWQVLGLVYGSLISVDPYNLEDIPWLAESWKIETRDNMGKATTILEFRLREDVKWHDGEPFTGKDVKATIEFLRDNRIPRYLDNVKDVEKILLPDRYTVRIYMKRASFWYLHGIGGLPVFPEHIIKDVDNWQNWQPTALRSPVDSEVTALVGTGPYIFEEYRPGEYVKFRVNPWFVQTTPPRGENQIQ